MNEEDILALCPRLACDGSWRIASPRDPKYNCFAWAAGDDGRNWDPLPTTAPTRAGVYWPPGVPLLPTVSAFVAAYESIGYEMCEDGAAESGFEKIAIYTSASGEPLHAARQLEDGRWTTKLGRSNDIEHTEAEGTSNAMFGEPTVFMRRARG